MPSHPDRVRRNYEERKPGCGVSLRTVASYDIPVTRVGGSETYWSACGCGREFYATGADVRAMQTVAWLHVEQCPDACRAVGVFGKPWGAHA